MNSAVLLKVPVQRIRVCVDSNIDSANKVFIDRIIDIFEKRVSKRCPAVLVSDDPDLTIKLIIDKTVGEQGYRITAEDKTTVSVRSDGHMGLLYGIGKFLHTSQYLSEGLVPSDWEGVSIPECSLRGIQLDTHFCNFYHMAPSEELAEYVEDLALWGINYIDVVFPFIDFLDWNDPEVGKITNQIHTIYVTAQSIGVKVGMEVVPNQDFVKYNEKFRAVKNSDPTNRRGNNGNNICPNIDGAMEYILSNTYGQVFKYLNDKGIIMDFLCFWPYDEGGCGCEECAPWGAGGFLKASRAIYEVAKTYLPEVKVILSTWLFDTPVEGEWEGLTRVLSKENDWIDFIMADSHADFPEHPIRQGVPGGLHLINYPEISMWGLHPWGGYGANPLPDRFERLWRQVSDIVSGGIAYSEGIFDDVNKIVVSQFYWNKTTTSDKTLTEYISYEFSHELQKDIREIMRIIEMNQTLTADGVLGTYANLRADIDSAKRATDLVRKVNDRMPEWARSSWRWRILAIRAQLDEERYQRVLGMKDDITPATTWTDVLRGSKTAKSAMEELVGIFHSNMNYDDSIHPMYRHVRPALKDI